VLESFTPGSFTYRTVLNLLIIKGFFFFAERI